MKKFFVMGAVVFASLSACSPDLGPVAVNDGSIKFVSVQTRATDETELSDLQKDESFQVFGYNKKETEIKTVFDNVKPKWDGVSTWTTTDIKYWEDAKNYNFYAFYPAQAVDASYEQASFVFDGNGAIDLVAAVNSEVVGNVFNSAVALNFKHQLSRVAINFINKFNDPNITIEVLEVVVSDVETGAKFTFVAPHSAANQIEPILTEPTTDNLTFTFDGNVNSIVGAEVGVTSYNSGKTNYMYFLPTADAKAYNLSCKIKYINNLTSPATVKEVLYPAGDEVLTLSETKYEAGQSYVFSANVYDELNPITFSVSVESWGVDKPAGNITIGSK